MWAVGDAYEAYVGRWSRRVATAFLDWLRVPAGRRWLDIGCGTGALTAAIRPAAVVGVDPSYAFLRGLPDVCVGDAQTLPFRDGSFDVTVSGLALNFVPDPSRAAAEMARVLVPGGLAAAYVWDYAGGMQMMRHFWSAAASLDPAAAELDEGRRFPLCQPDALRELWRAYADVEVRALEVPTVFADFDDFWRPFLGGTGPAPAYAMELPAARRDALRDLLRTRLPDGPIPLTARAWAVRGYR